MKKIFVTIFTGASLALALNSCNNAAEVQKQKDADAAAVQAAVDAKLNSLQTEASAWCDSVVLATAQPIADSLIAADAKAAGKPAPKPKPKPKPKAEEPEKKPATGLGGKDKLGTENSGPSKLGEGKQGTQESGPKKLGEGKLGTKPQ